MRQVVGGRAVDAQAASASQMGRFETVTLALAGEPGGAGRPERAMDRPVPRPQRPQVCRAGHGQLRQPDPWRSGRCTAWNGHFDCTCYHPNFPVQPVRHAGTLRPASMATSTAPTAGGTCSTPSSPATRQARPHGGRSSAPTPPTRSPRSTRGWKMPGFFYAIRMQAKNAVLRRSHRPPVDTACGASLENQGEAASTRSSSIRPRPGISRAV